MAKRQYDSKIWQRVMRTHRGPRNFWSFVKSVSTNFVKSATSPFLTADGNILVELRKRAKQIATYFAIRSFDNEKDLLSI